MRHRHSPLHPSTWFLTVSKTTTLSSATLRFLRESLIYLFFSVSLICLVEWCAGLNLAVLQFLQTSYREVGITALLLASSFALLDTLLRRRYFSMLVLSLPIIMVAFISRQKLGYLSEPLYPWDFIFAEQIYKLLPELAGEKPLQVITVSLGSLAMLITTLWLIKRAHQQQRGKLPGRPILACSLLALTSLVVCTNSASGLKWAQNTLAIQPLSWIQVDNYKEKGFILAFAMNMRAAFIERPDMSSKALMQELANLSHAPVSHANEQQPDIIIVMSEAFWDPTRLPAVHLSLDPMPTIRALSAGDIFSPSQGGYTSNVEFEFLTGFSNAFLPVGSVPYQQYFQRNIPSVIWALKSQGYQAIAMHSYHKYFWNRDNVYRHLGFDRFLALEDLPGLPLRGPFVSDGALFEQLYETLDATTQPTVLFAVTMQNHGPYEKGRYGQSAIPMELDSQIDEHDAIQTYSQGIHEADEAFKSLLARLSQRTRPSLVVFFGDHTPYLGKDFSAYRQSGLIDNAPTEELSGSDYVHLHKTPLVIWSSVPAEQASPLEKLISPSMLPGLLMEKLNFQHPFYSGVLQELSQKFPVIERRILRSQSGEWIEHWHGHDDASLKRYQAIQYDMMFGDQVSHAALFQEMPLQ